MSENELLATFIEEAQENLQIMEESLLELENDPTDKNILDMIFRAMHSIKGSAGLVGLNKISDIAHHLENILEELRQQKREVSQEDFNLLFAGTDIIRNMINTEDFSGEEREDEIADLLHKLEQHRNLESTSDVNGNTNEKQEEPKEHHLYNIEMKFREDIFETGTDPLMLILELQEQGIILASNVKTKKLPEIYDLEPHKFYLSWELYLLSAESQENIEDVFIFVQDENDINIKKLEHKPDNYLELNENILQLLKQQDIITAQEIETLLNEENNISSLLKQKQVTREQETENTQLNSSKKIKQKREQKTSSTVRVESEKLEEILNDIAELLIAQSGVKELNSDYLEQVDRSRKMEILNSYEDVDKIIRRIQEKVMNASMIPIAGVFTRLQRQVRDMARNSEKKVRLEVKGKDTELDRKIIEQLADPLKHLIRNSFDHGLERPEVRLDKGKDETGLILMEAFHKEGNIVIKVSDDGAGIDKESVLQKALDQGLINSKDEVSDNEVSNLLFEPGFSTAEEVSDISGRGVGLDVVQNNINNIRGKVNIDSQKDEGTTFTIKLPLTLAIIDGMLIQIGEDKFVIPLNSIREFLDATQQKYSRLEGKGCIINIRDEYIPYLSLFRLLDMPAHKVEATDIEEGIIVILQNEQKQMALQVDDILGQEQVVIKNVRENMGQVPGVTGATILGDGNVALILDVVSLFQIAREMVDFP